MKEVIVLGELGLVGGVSPPPLYVVPNMHCNTLHHTNGVWKHYRLSKQQYYLGMVA